MFQSIVRAFFCCLTALQVTVSLAWAEPWSTALFKDAETVEIRTVVPGEGEYWFPVWVVTVDDQVFVRLGKRASSRIERNETFPEVSIRIAGNEFHRVRAEPVPSYVDAVNAAMADKYFSDIFIRWASHPMTLRLSEAGDPKVP